MIALAAGFLVGGTVTGIACWSMTRSMVRALVAASRANRDLSAEVRRLSPIEQEVDTCSSNAS